MLEAEIIKANWDEYRSRVNTLFPTRADKLNKLYDDYEERIIMMPASSVAHYHNAFAGGYIDHVLRVIDCVEKLMNDNVIPKFIEDRYEDWNKNLGQFIHNKDTGLDDINKKVIDDNIEPEPRSGRQEYLENILNKYL